MYELLKLAREAAREAGITIMHHYAKPLSVKHKRDGSPFTLADLSAHRKIVHHLAKSGISVVSEEGEDLFHTAESYWLIDPLDGTKDFLAGNGEFTVNIALIDRSCPLLGVVFAPATNTMYWGAAGMGAWRTRDDEEEKLVPRERSDSLRMVVSRFHNHPDVDIFATQNRVVDRVAMGAALKYGSLASGEVDVFPRLVGSSEWDTAAGQAVLEAADGHVLDWNTGKPLRYGKPQRRNPRIVALRAPYRYEEFQLKRYESELL